jgi:hypothetical protein
VAPRKPTILLVTEDLEPSQAISAWLREAGLRVIGCLPWSPTQRALLGAVFRRLPGSQAHARYAPGTVNAEPWNGGQVIGSPV